MTDDERMPTLLRLGESDLILVDPAQDVRGRTVVARSGEEIGVVDDLLVDEGERRVRFLEVTAGGILGLGERHLLLPVEAVTRVDAERVHVDQTRERVAGSPDYDPRIVPPPDYFAGVYDWFGNAPFWTPVAVPERDVERGPGDRVGGRWEIPVGTKVVGADGEKVGEVVAAYRDYVVVQKGFFFPSDRYVPASAIAGYDGERVRLTVTKEQALAQSWEAIPPVEPADDRGASGSSRRQRSRGDVVVTDADDRRNS